MSLSQFGKNAILYSSGTIAVRGTTFILIPIYTQHLTVSDFGLLVTLLLTIQVLGTIIDFGVLNSLMRFSHEFSQKNREGELLGSAYAINVISGFCVLATSIIILTPLFQFVLQIENALKFVLLSCLVAFTQSLSINFISYFRACNEGIWYTILSLLSAVLTLVLSFIFITQLKLGVEGALFANIKFNVALILPSPSSHLSNPSNNRKILIK